MGTKDFAYKKKAHITQSKTESKVDNNLKKYMYDLHKKQDLIGATIFTIVLLTLLFFMPKNTLSSEKPIKDEITEWYETTSKTIQDQVVEFSNLVVSTPDKIGIGLSNFWQETKTYQIESWSKTREENPVVFSTIDKLKEYFVPTETKTNE
jgi:hypothetical protein